MGCPDVFPPIHAFAKRSGDDVVVRCNQTGETWYLTCKDDRWIGEYGNCTAKTHAGDLGGNNTFFKESKSYFMSNS